MLDLKSTQSFAVPIETDTLGGIFSGKDGTLYGWIKDTSNILRLTTQSTSNVNYNLPYNIPGGTRLLNVKTDAAGNFYLHFADNNSPYIYSPEWIQTGIMCDTTRIPKHLYDFWFDVDGHTFYYYKNICGDIEIFHNNRSIGLWGTTINNGTLVSQTVTSCDGKLYAFVEDTKQHQNHVQVFDYRAHRYGPMSGLKFKTGQMAQASLQVDGQMVFMMNFLDTTKQFSAKLVKTTPNVILVKGDMMCKTTTGIVVVDNGKFYIINKK
jgi:hypothetical protein